MVPHPGLNSLEKFFSFLFALSHMVTSPVQTLHRYMRHRLKMLMPTALGDLAAQVESGKKSFIVIFFTVACKKSHIVSAKNSCT